MLGKIFPGFIAAALVLFGTVSARAQINDEVIAAAKREGSVTLYAAFPSAPLYAAVTRSFQAKYGVRVDVLQIRASELHERIRAEQAAGRFLGDVLQASDASTQLRIADRHVGRLGTIPNGRNMVPGMEPTEHRIGAFIGAFGIMVNTNLVKPEDEPKSWTDLLDPRWKGKILLDDPRALGSGHTFFTGLQRLLGTDYHRKFVTNLPVLSRDVGASERRVGLGEFPIWIPAATNGMRGLQGLPVRYIAPKEGLPHSVMDQSILTNAPHPNAARLFVDHFASIEFQTEVAAIGFLPVLRDMEQRMPPQLQPFARAPLLPSLQVETQQQMLNLASELYK